MTIYVICRGQGGAHEPDEVYSVWLDLRAAYQERDRLRADELIRSPEKQPLAPVDPDEWDQDEWVVTSVEANTASDECINFVPTEVPRP